MRRGGDDSGDNAPRGGVVTRSRSRQTTPNSEVLRDADELEPPSQGSEPGRNQKVCGTLESQTVTSRRSLRSRTPSRRYDDDRIEDNTVPRKDGTKEKNGGKKPTKTKRREGSRESRPTPRKRKSQTEPESSSTRSEGAACGSRVSSSSSKRAKTKKRAVSSSSGVTDEIPIIRNLLPPDGCVADGWKRKDGVLDMLSKRTFRQEVYLPLMYTRIQSVTFLEPGLWPRVKDALTWMAQLFEQVEIDSEAHGQLLLLFMCLPRLVFRAHGNGPQAANRVQTLVRRFNAGNLKQLVSMAMKQCSNYKEMGSDSEGTPRPEATVKTPSANNKAHWRAHWLALAGNGSKANRLTVNRAKMPSDDQIERELPHLFKEDEDPATEYEPEVMALLTTPSIALDADDVRKAARNSKQGETQDMWGWHARLLLPGLLDNDVVNTLVKYVFEPFARGVVPGIDGEWRGGLLMALGKSADKIGVRPIVAQGCIPKLAVKSCLGGYKAALAEYFSLAHARVVQHGGGAKDGATHCIKSIQLRLEQRSADGDGPQVLISLDVKAAFQNFQRLAMFDTLVGTAARDYWGGPGIDGSNGVRAGEKLRYAFGGLKELLPHIYAKYGKKAWHLYFPKERQGLFRRIYTHLGVQQGDPLAAILFALAIHHVLCRVMDRHPGIYLDAYADNLFLQGALLAAWDAAVDVKGALEDIGLELNPKESWIFSREWQHDSDKRQLQGVKTALQGYRHAKRSKGTLLPLALRTEGCIILGVPVGTDRFVKKETRKAIQGMTDLLPAYGQVLDGRVHLFLIRDCFNAKPVYLLQHVAPRLAGKYALEFDRAVEKHLVKYCQWAGDDEKLPPSASEQLRQPRQAGGFGVRPHAPRPGEGQEVGPDCRFVAQYYCATARSVQWIAARELTIQNNNVADTAGPSLVEELRGTAVLTSKTIKELTECHRHLLDLGASEYTDEAPEDSGREALHLPTLANLIQFPGNAQPLRDLTDLPLQQRVPPSQKVSALEARQDTARREIIEGRSELEKARMQHLTVTRMAVRNIDSPGSPGDALERIRNAVAATGDVEGAATVSNDALAVLDRPEFNASDRDPIQSTVWCFVTRQLLGLPQQLPKGAKCPGCHVAIDAGAHHVQVCQKVKGGAKIMGHDRVVEALRNQCNMGRCGATATTSRAAIPGPPLGHPQPERRGDLLVYGTDEILRELGPGIVLDAKIRHPFSKTEGRNEWGAQFDEQCVRKARLEKDGKHRGYLWQRGYSFTAAATSSFGVLDGGLLRWLWITAVVETRRNWESNDRSPTSSDEARVQYRRERDWVFRRNRREVVTCVHHAAAQRALMAMASRSARRHKGSVEPSIPIDVLAIGTTA